MRYILVLLLFSFAIFSMQDSSDMMRKQILSLAKSRVRHQIDRELLEISRQTGFVERNQVIKEFKYYYYFGQPIYKTSRCAYLKKPVVNTKKMFAYLELLATSTYQRRTELWPLISIPYELEEMADRLDYIHKSAYDALLRWNQQSHPQTVSILQTISADALAVRRAIALCQQSVENEK
jgi:hypothetical protein